MKKFLYAAAMAAWAVCTASAAPVSPQEAMDIASDLLAGELAPTLRPGATAAPSQVKIAYTASDNSTDCFYVVNYPEGFVIVSADTRLPEVLGYSAAGQFDPDRISQDFRWWLDSYQKEISSWLPSAPESASKRCKAQLRAERKAIKPMLTTQWNQGEPYNNDCPRDPQYGVKSVTGCVATAMAQLMKYHAWPQHPEGNNQGVDFDGSTLDWASMIDNYETQKYNAKQAAAVAQLMRQCGAAVNMNYSATGSGAYDYNVQTALRKYFKYAPDLKFYWKDYVPQSRWNDIVYTELAAGRPVYYSGSSNQGGHAFVCDGYDKAEYFHFNWGWGGYQDGYFRLTALNPSAGGAGSYEGGYNNSQTIITGIRPSDGDAPLQSTLLSTGAFCYDEEKFVIKESIIEGYNMLYNPLGYEVEVMLGTRIVNLDDPEGNVHYASTGEMENVPPMYGFTEMIYNFPTLPDGNYHLYPVFTTDRKTWQDVQIPLGKQTYVTLTVAAGKMTFSNDGPDPNSAPNLIMGTPRTDATIYAEAQKSFVIPFLNTGKGDYLGEIGFSLFGEGEYGDVISLSNQVSIPGESYAELTFDSSESMAPGTYSLFITDGEGKTISDKYKYTVVADKFESPSMLAPVTAGELAPCYYTADTEHMLYMTLSNHNSIPSKIKIKIIFYDQASLKPAATLTAQNEITVPGSAQMRLNFGPSKMPLAPGRYMWQIFDGDDRPISVAAPLTVTSAIKSCDGIAYIITDEAKKRATVVAPEAAPYQGSTVVPESLDGYTPVSLRQDAFAFAKSTDVSLPTSIHSLQPGAFFNASFLRHLTLGSESIVTRSDNTFAPDAKSKTWIGVPEGMANEYARSPYWQHFRFPFWMLEPGEGTAFIGLQKDPATGLPFHPYYVSPDEKIEFTVSGPAGKNVLYWTIVDGDWNGSVVAPLTQTVSAPALGWTGGRITLEATSRDVAVKTIDDEQYDAPADIFSIDGRLIISHADREAISNLQPGIYIRRSEKFIVR